MGVGDHSARWRVLSRRSRRGRGESRVPAEPVPTSTGQTLGLRPGRLLMLQNPPNCRKTGARVTMNGSHCYGFKQGSSKQGS